MTAFLLSIWTAIKAGLNWFWFKASFKLKVAIVGSLVALIVLAYILILHNRTSELEKDLHDANFNRQMVNVDQYTNQIEQLEKEGNVLQQNSNIADANRNSVDRRDSNSFTGNATDRFCARYPKDSSCAEWRKRNNR